MIRFIYPELFFLFLPLLFLIIWSIVYNKSDKYKFKKVGNTQVRNFLFSKVLFNRVNTKNWLFIIAFFFLIIASVGPQVGTRMKELKRKGVDIMILLDTSVSMNAVDVMPSRLEKAKYELSHLINNLKGDRIGMIVFSGSAHLHLPLTTDYSAARLFLNSIDTKIIESPGTNLYGALELGLKQIEEQNEKYKVIILVSDGEEHQGEVLPLAKDARNRGILVYSVGVGTSAGGPIPILDKNGKRIEFKKDNKGQVVTTVLNEQVLNEISIITNSKYYRIENQANALGPLSKELESLEKQELKSQVFSQYEDRYQIFLLLSLLCLMIEYFIPTRNKLSYDWEGRYSK